jgi:hypothetical protein
MNLAHVHLLLNHFPVIATVLGLLLLVWGIYRRSPEVRTASFLVFILAALVAIPTFRTGEPAEELIEHMPGVSRDLIHDHEEAAEVTIWIVEVLGVVALAALIWQRKRGATPAWLVLIVLLIALGAAGALGWTANLGGKIRHPEINSAGTG